MFRQHDGWAGHDPIERSGVLWMGRSALSAAFGLEGAFNDVTLTLAPGARTEDVLPAVAAVDARRHEVLRWVMATGSSPESWSIGQRRR